MGRQFVAPAQHQSTVMEVPTQDTYNGSSSSSQQRIQASAFTTDPINISDGSTINTDAGSSIPSSENRTNELLSKPDNLFAELKQLSDLGRSASAQFYELNQLTDLDTAISCFVEISRIMPNEYLDKAGNLAWLGNLLCTRFERLGNVLDLNMAIEHTNDVMT
ncbi:hypothetical protein FRC12_004921 [Ceratobasidium sp. 428]|nr:hypothetical protein FRC12_004921 [Ceratobasidium sp. 428]